MRLSSIHTTNYIIQGKYLSGENYQLVESYASLTSHLSQQYQVKVEEGEADQIRSYHRLVVVTFSHLNRDYSV